ncbi:TetR/AcrR family transcriptional regulator [Streptomyces sp. SID14478]|uniref:ScbR family autoregulator-binding transcription factor n=1 Tax=Streptomyces sp. SID14478 TaxID=2706073 RepID=UPI0013DC6929|nr:ScbR family autoregulator-binding transcription factor [Streptomyces sp. SID14478]NEB77928.1 TetR/AcrR family transcriptional regulator [Streptomyces sp. SID14478]
MQARSERTRHNLIQAGARMFNEHGYASATLGRIVAVTGVTKGALYFHFASKDVLADAVQEEGSARLVDFLRRREDAGASPVQVLIDMTHWLSRALREDPVVGAGLRITHECVDREPPVTDFHRVWNREVVRLLREAAEAGELRPAGRDEGAATLLWATVCGLAAVAKALPTDELARRLAASWDLLLTLLVPPHEADRYRTHAPDGDPVDVA